MGWCLCIMFYIPSISWTMVETSLFLFFHASQIVFFYMKGKMFGIGLWTVGRLAQINRSVGMSGLVLITQKVNNACCTFTEGRERDVCYGGSDDTGARKTMRLMEMGLKFQREREEAEGRISLAPWGGRHASPTGKLPGDDGYVRARRKGRRAADSAGSLAKVNNGGETAKILRRGLQAQGNSWEQNKKDRSFVFPAVLGGHFIGGCLHLKVKKRKDATVSTVERASFAVLPVTWTTLIWLVKKKNHSNSWNQHKCLQRQETQQQP